MISFASSGKTSCLVVYVTAVMSCLFTIQLNILVALSIQTNGFLPVYIALCSSS